MLTLDQIAGALSIFGRKTDRTSGTYAHGGFEMRSKRPSNQAEILDTENEILNAEVQKAYDALWLHARPARARINMITGANDGKDISVRRWTDLSPRYSYVPENYARSVIGSVATATMAIQTVFAEEHPNRRPLRGDYARFRRGFAAWRKAVTEPHGTDRTHQFVRALESVVYPPQGKTRRRFVSRLSPLVTINSGESPRVVVGDIYDLRSKVEHMHSFWDAFPKSPIREAYGRALRRSFQCERLTHGVLRRILTSPGLLQHFIDDQSTSTFWSMAERARDMLFGSHIDMSLTPQEEERIQGWLDESTFE